MSQTLFRTVPIVPQSRLQKWLKQQPEENAVIELNNLLASTPIRDISATDVRAIEEKYAINLKEEFNAQDNITMSQSWSRQKLAHLVNSIGNV